MTTLALIGLGSNLGDRKAHLDAAIEAFRSTPGITVRALSSYRETQPVGGPSGQGPFLNAAAAIETSLEPLDLLTVLQEVEKQECRERTTRWGERTLDLDLLIYDDRIIDTRPVVNGAFGCQAVALRVPHPWMPLRRFVLDPLAEIAPEVVDPLTGRTIVDLLSNVDRRPGYVAMIGAYHDPYRSHVFNELVAAMGAVGVSDAQPSSPRSRRGLRDQRSDLEAVLERRCEALRKDRWADLGTRWLISDFAFSETALLDASVHSATGMLDDPQVLDRFFRRCLEKERDVVAPTFTVELGTPPAPYDRFAEPARDELRTPPLASPRFQSSDRPRVPSLYFASGKPSVIVSEIVAACTATRTG
jgi:2-amino-4-hydroxy-6-hydroxymethyldihydropteridine diphosphokinase